MHYTFSASLFFFLFIFSSSVSATLVTAKFHGTVSYASTNSAASVGDTFNVFATYDDSSLVMHTYNDGADGIANFGSGDDSVSTTYCTGIMYGTPNCTDNFTGYSFFADAIFNVSQLLDLLQPSDSHTKHNLFSQNRGIVYGNSSGHMIFEMMADSFLVVGDTASQNDGVFYHHITATGALAATRVSVNYTVTTSPVPEPSAIALMGLGLLGFGATRRKQKKNVTIQRV